MPLFAKCILTDHFPCIWVFLGVFFFCFRWLSREKIQRLRKSKRRQNISLKNMIFICFTARARKGHWPRPRRTARDVTNSRYKSASRNAAPVSGADSTGSSFSLCPRLVAPHSVQIWLKLLLEHGTSFPAKNSMSTWRSWVSVRFAASTYGSTWACVRRGGGCWRCCSQPHEKLEQNWVSRCLKQSIKRSNVVRTRMHGRRGRRWEGGIEREEWLTTWQNCWRRGRGPLGVGAIKAAPLWGQHEWPHFTPTMWTASYEGCTLMSWGAEDGPMWRNKWREYV